jgi:uncharacterized membrane protein
VQSSPYAEVLGLPVALLGLTCFLALAYPEGIEFAAAIVWRGVLYGAADGLLLSVFAILAVFAARASVGAKAARRSSG